MVKIGTPISIYARGNGTKIRGQKFRWQKHLAKIFYSRKFDYCGAEHIDLLHKSRQATC